ncbi:MAG: hypothetical protein ABR510_11775 [Trueperaceae bacterium]
MSRTSAVVIVVAVVLALSGVACAQGLQRGALLLSGDHRLGPTEGHVLVVGGRGAADADARIDGVVVLLDGALTIDGEVAGDVFLMGGTLALGDRARVGGRIVVAGGELRASDAATVAGGVTRDLEAAAEAIRPTPTPAQRAGRFLSQTLLLALAAFVAVLLVPHATTRTAEAIRHHPVVTVAMGALSGLIGVVLLVAMAFTVVLIPAALIGFFLFGVAVVFGWLAFGRLVGRALRRLGVGPLGARAEAVVGAVAFVVALNAVAAVPWIGAPLSLLASVMALGAVVLTGFGWRRFVPDQRTSEGMSEGARKGPQQSA